MLIFLLISIGFFLLFFIVGKALSTKPYRGKRSTHFNGKRFLNPSRRSAKGFKYVFKYMFESKKDRWESERDFFVRESQIPVLSEDKIEIHFVNHSSFLIQLGKLNILTDPIWSKYCSPVPLPMLKRKRPPGIPFELLPPIDLVLVSHNHYDHMDKKTIQRLQERDEPLFISCLGNANTLARMGGEKVVELDWWKSTAFKNISIEAVPANHFSSRGTFDRNTSLWCGFIITFETKRLYFVGDTGYGDNFKELGKNRGPFDLAFIPIGAYKPSWFMGPIHVSPEEALLLHQDVRSKKSIAMHYGTFALADDSPKEAIKAFLSAREKHAVDETEFVLLEEGRSIVLS